MDLPTISVPEGAADGRGGVGARGSLAKDAGLILAAGGVCLALALAVQTEKGQALFGHLQTLCAGLQGSGSSGGWAVGLLLFVGLGGLLVAAGVPRLWISAAAGAVYGAAWGSLWALAASLLGAMAVYGVGHTFLGGMMERRLGRNLAVWRERFRARAFWWVLYGRLFPLSNSTLLSLVCGSCRVPWGAYLAGSALGFVPLNLVFAVFGHGGRHGRVGIVALGFGLLWLTLGLRYLMLHSSPAPRQARRTVKPGFPDVKGNLKEMPVIFKGSKRRLALWALVVTALAAGGTYLYYQYWTYRFETISAGKVFASAAMPTARLESYARRYGLRTVIDLRGERLQDEVEAEGAALSRLGVRHVHLPSKQIPSPEVVERFLEIMEDPAAYPVLIHCEHGQGRTMVLAAVYRMEFEDWDNARALDATRWINIGTSFDRDTSKGRFILQYAPRRAKSDPVRGMSPGAADGLGSASRQPAAAVGLRPPRAAAALAAVLFIQAWGKRSP